ncbi:MAG: hypothetical protein V1908_03080 [Candidatus Peregrinibacteria bacterium]
MERFLTFSYYFTSRPDPNFGYTKFAAACILILLVASLALRVYRKRYCQDEIKRKLLRRYPGLLQNYATFLLALLLFRETGMPWFSMRFWWFLIAIFFLYHLFQFVFGFKKQYRERMVAQRKHDPYFPRQKH